LPEYWKKILRDLIDGLPRQLALMSGEDVFKDVI